MKGNLFMALQPNEVKTINIADSAVKAEKIAVGAVTGGKLGSEDADTNKDCFVHLFSLAILSLIVFTI